MNRIFTVAVVVIAAALIVWIALRDGGAGSHAAAGTRPESARPAAAAPTTDVNTAIDACLAGFRAVADRRANRGAPTAPGEPSDSGAVAKACAPLYHEAACREAQLHFDDPPSDTRSQVVLDACKKDYCGKLPAPKPRICNPDQPPPEDGLATFQSWDELRTAIWKHDLGEAGAARLEAALSQ